MDPWSSVSVRSATLQDEKSSLLNPASLTDSTLDVSSSARKGLGVASTSFFILTGVLFMIPLPYALLQTGLISGVMVMVMMPLVMVYMAVLLGRCWIMMMERWPEKYSGQHVRRPFPAIGREAGGRFWENAVRVSVNVTNFGVTVVDLLVAVTTIQNLVPGRFSDRIWLLFCTAAMMPFVWLGSPMESWVVGWAGGLLALVASFLLFPTIIVGGMSAAIVPTTVAITTSTLFPNVTQAAATVATPTMLPALSDTVTFSSFWIGTSTLSFSYAGMSIFPTLQHDMREPRKWPHALIGSYVFIAVCSLATAVVGLAMFGKQTNANILANVLCHQSDIGHRLVTACSAAYAVVSLCNGVVTVLPLVQDVEELIGLPSSKTNAKHIITRTTIVLMCLGAAEGIPHFDQYISLVGATAISMNNFVFPPLFYTWLSREKGVEIGLGHKAFFAEMIVLGIISAVAGSYSSIENIIGKEGPDPC